MADHAKLQFAKYDGSPDGWIGYEEALFSAGASTIDDSGSSLTD